MMFGIFSSRKKAAIVIVVGVPADAISVNSNKVARMMADPSVADECRYCPFAEDCETLANFLATLDDEPPLEP